MLLGLLVVAGTLVGCNIGSYDDAVKAFNSNTQPPPPAPPPPGPPPPPPPPGASFGPNFSEIQAAVFTPSCASANCHGGNDPEGLNLQDGNSYAMLVNVASSQQPGVLRVNPGNPDMSYLIQKMENAPGIDGNEMPPGAQLPQVDIDVIKTWIADGAVDDTASSTVSIAVASMAPLPGAVLSAPPASIVIRFDRAPDATTIHNGTVVLEASGGDMTFADGNEAVVIPASVTVPASSPRSAILDLSGLALADDTYRVTVMGSGPLFVMDLDANALNGDAAGSPGRQDYEAWFTVAVPR